MTTDAIATYLQLEYKSDARDPYIGECPTWCDFGEHKIAIADCDRYHHGEVVVVPIRDFPSTPFKYPDESGNTVIWHELGHTQMYLQQGIRDHEPTVHVVLNDSPVHVDLTVDEAETIGSALLAMVEAAR